MDWTINERFNSTGGTRPFGRDKFYFRPAGVTSCCCANHHEITHFAVIAFKFHVITRSTLSLNPSSITLSSLLRKGSLGNYWRCPCGALCSPMNYCLINYTCSMCAFYYLVFLFFFIRISSREFILFCMIRWLAARGLSRIMICELHWRAACTNAKRFSSPLIRPILAVQTTSFFCCL